MPAAKPGRFRRWWRSSRLWQRIAVTVVVCLIGWPLVMTIVYTIVPPPFSNLQLLRLFSGNGLDRRWVSISQISPSLVRAVISSEDQRFCQHNGVDWVEFSEVYGDALDNGEAPSRGASTISMQTAKNMFLWDGRNPLRKLLEVPLAVYMDTIWTKRRMIEIYLNNVEWAPGVYGAEAAARFHFKKSAAKLSRREAALLAAVLPNPIKRSAGKPSRGVRRIADRIMIRSMAIGPYVACVQ